MHDRPSDDEVRAAYADLGSVWAAGERLGIAGQTVHKRLKKLGVDTAQNLFTEAERERLRQDYATYRAHGRVSELAEQMGRTVQFLSRQARALGLTDANHEKVWRGRWKHMGDVAARELFDAFKTSPLGLMQWCAKFGYDDEGFRRVIRERWPDEWDLVVESKAALSTPYRLGRAVEYRFRDRLKADGYFVLRSPASKSPIDLVAIKPGQVLFIQCKKSGALPPKEWNPLYDLAISAGAVPILAENPYPKFWRYWRLTGRKDGSKRRQPMEPFTPDVTRPALELAAGQ